MKLQTIHRKCDHGKRYLDSHHLLIYPVLYKILNVRINEQKDVGLDNILIVL